MVLTFYLLISKLFTSYKWITGLSRAFRSSKKEGRAYGVIDVDRLITRDRCINILNQQAQSLSRRTWSLSAALYVSCSVWSSFSEHHERRSIHHQWSASSAWRVALAGHDQTARSLTVRWFAHQRQMGLDRSTLRLVCTLYLSLSLIALFRLQSRLINASESWLLGHITLLQHNDIDKLVSLLHCSHNAVVQCNVSAMQVLLYKAIG